MVEFGHWEVSVERVLLWCYSLDPHCVTHGEGCFCGSAWCLLAIQSRPHTHPSSNLAKTFPLENVLVEIIPIQFGQGLVSVLILAIPVIMGLTIVSFIFL